MLVQASASLKLVPSGKWSRYRKFYIWRSINGDYECDKTQESKDWVRNNSDWYCPICGDNYSQKGGKSIDHKLPRSQYPWLSMEFENLWVICQTCNQGKSEMHWYEYEHYMLIHHPNFSLAVKAVRPSKMLQFLRK
jgi:5-methylcytosine-specific restriction endonuclease McrA